MKLLGTHLDNLLRHWEDYQLVAGGMFEIFRTGSKHGADARKVAPRAGSELGPSWGLVRSIKEYQNLRKWLEDPTAVSVESPYQFLPRVPKDLLGKVSQFDIVRSYNVPNQLMIPYMVQKWGGVRRAITVESGVIQPLDLRTEYWLDALPYPALYIRYENEYRIDNSLHVGHATSHNMPAEGWDMNNILVVAGENGQTHIMVWSDEVEHCLMSPEQEKDFRDATAAVRSSKVKLFQKLAQKLQATVDSMGKGFCGFASISPGGIGRAYSSDFKPLTASIYTMEDGKTLVGVVEIVNRICRICAEAHVNSPFVEIGTEMLHQVALSPRYQQSWHVVDISQTIEIGRLRANSSHIVVKRAGGYTVQPHYRRQHVRIVRYKNEKGEWDHRPAHVGATLVNAHLLAEGTIIKSGGIHIVPPSNEVIT